MKKVEPRDLEVGKTYFATNLSTERRPIDLVSNKRYIVTVSGKKDAPSGPLFDRSKMPLELYLTNIKEIQGKGEGKGWDEILVMRHEYPDWWNMTDITDVPKFYEKDSIIPIGVSHVVESKEEKKKELKKSTDDILLNTPRDTLGQSKDKLARLRVPEDVSKFMGSFGGRKPKRKTHRRKRSKTRRRKRSKTHRRKRSKTRRKRKSRRKRRKSRSRRK